MKICPDHGPIDWPVTATKCPVATCGHELEYFPSALEASLRMAALVARTMPVKSKKSPAPARAINDPSLFPEPS